MKKINNQGFTLVEILVTVAILAIITSLVIGGYLIYDKQAKEYAYEVSRDSIISSALLYYQEKDLQPVAAIDNKNYYCITVNDLVNSGYHDKKEIENVERITLDTYIKITENANTLTREKQELINNDVLDICNVASQVLKAKTKEVYSNKIVGEVEKLKFYQNYTCYYKQGNGAYINGTYIDGEEYGYCHFNDLTPDTNYTYKVCATASLGSKEYEACSEEIDERTKSIDSPQIIEHSYFIANREYKKSDGYNFDTWSNDKVINLEYNYNNVNKDTSYLMFYVNTSNTTKATNTKLLKCNNESCTNSSNVNRNTLLSSGWYGLKLSNIKEDTTTISLRINKSNVNIKAKIYDGTNNSNTIEYTTSKIDNVKPNISSITQTNNYNSTQRQVKINTYDADSGVDKIYISTSNNTPTINSSGWITLSQTTYQTYLNIERTYYMWVMDKAKNISTVKSFYVKNPDTTPPTLDNYTNRSYCSGDYLYFNYTISASDAGGRVTIYQQITTSSRYPSANDSNWTSYTTTNRLSCGKTYYLYVKLVDRVGNTTVKYVDSQYCSCPEPEPDPPTQNSDCKIICIMRKARDNWQKTTNTLEKEQWHAINSILAGDLKYPTQMIYVGGNVGSWYYQNQLMENWYKSNCSATTTCANPTWQDYNNKRYSFYNIETTATSCSLYNELYPSGVCSDGQCNCCKRGTGWYQGTCYDK